MLASLINHIYHYDERENCLLKWMFSLLHFKLFIWYTKWFSLWPERYWSGTTNKLCLPDCDIVCYKWYPCFQIADLFLCIDALSGDSCHENPLDVLCDMSIILIPCGSSLQLSKWILAGSQAVLFLCLLTGRPLAQTSPARAVGFSPAERWVPVCQISWVCECVG